MDTNEHEEKVAELWRPAVVAAFAYLFSVRSAAVLGSSNVSAPNTPELYQISPVPDPLRPRTGGQRETRTFPEKAATSVRTPSNSVHRKRAPDAQLPSP